MKSAVKLMFSVGMALGLAGHASAFVCTLGAAGDQCVLNWDASALGSNLNASAAGIGANANSGQLSYAWFDNLNAGGVAGPSGTVSNVGDVLFSFRFQGTDPVFDDGRVSLRLTWISGRYEVGNVDLKFTDTSGNFLTTGAAPGTNGVPVAPTLALVFAGLGAMAAVRRRAV